MSEQYGVALIMPAYNEEEHLKDTISSIPEIVDLILFINDGSTDSTLETANKHFIESNRSNFGNRISELNYKIITQENQGVGSAVVRGLKEIIELDKNNDLKKQFPNKNKWIVIIMDSDGQMDSNDIPELIKPLVNNSADHVKGNRIGLQGMPKIRKIGSYLLKKLMRVASGYPKINDTQSGFRAINLEMIKIWDFNTKWDDYGYTNWWLLESGRRSFKLKEIEVKSIYKGEKSKLKIRRFLPKVSLLIFKSLWKRGWQWYVLGRGTVSNKLRIIFCIIWFSTIFSLFGMILFRKYHIYFLTYSIFGLIITRKLDVVESERRLNQPNSPLIN